MAYYECNAEKKKTISYKVTSVPNGWNGSTYSTTVSIYINNTLVKSSTVKSGDSAAAYVSVSGTTTI